MQMADNDHFGATDGRRTVAGAGFFRATEGKGTVSYMLNEGYCNIRCPHCYVNRVKTLPRRRDASKARLDIQSLREDGYRVQLRGTELILHEGFIPLFALAQQDYVQTNALHIAKCPQVLDDLWAAGVRYVIVTYPFDPDGFVDIEPHVADRAIELASERFGVTISILITRRVAANLGSLGDFCERSRLLGARAVKFVRLIPVTPDLLPFTPTVEESRSVLKEIARLKAAYSQEQLVLQTPGCFGLFEFRRSLALERFSSIDLEGIYDCPAGIKNFVIDLRNDVYPCLYMMDLRRKIGKFSGGRIVLSEQAMIPGALRSEDCPAYSSRLKTSRICPDGLEALSAQPERAAPGR